MDASTFSIITLSISVLAIILIFFVPVGMWAPEETNENNNCNKHSNYNSEYIVCAAMYMDDDSIITGVRHMSPDMRLVLNRIYGEGYHKRIKTQGFITNKGKFVSRKEAWVIADRMGQIRRETGYEGFNAPRPANIGDDGILFSENLY